MLHIVKQQQLAVGAEVDHAMSREEEGDSTARGHRRESDSPEAFVQHVRAADTGISLGWRWVQIAVTVVSAFFIAGMIYAGFDNMKTEMAGMRGDVSELKRNYTASDKQSALMQQDLKSKDEKIARLETRVDTLSSQIDTMRNMREAYVYAASAKKPPAPTPP